MKNTKYLVITSFFLILLIIFSKIVISTPLIPFTLQTLIVYLIALVLPLKYASLCIFSYTVLGLIGLPIFAMPAIGFLSISFGYIIGFNVAVPIISLLKEKSKLLSLSSGALIILLFGSIYAALFVKTFTPIDEIFTSYFLIFLPAEALKLILAIPIANKLIGIAKIIDK